MQEIERILFKNAFRKQPYISLRDPSSLFKNEKQDCITVKIDETNTPVKITYLSHTIGCYHQMIFHKTENFEEESIYKFLVDCYSQVILEESKLV